MTRLILVLLVREIIVLATVAVTMAAPQHLDAARYPAGVNPASCPDYPNCDNAALHNPQPQNHWNAPQQHQWNPQPQWNAPAPYTAPAPAYNNPSPNHWNPQWNAPALQGPAHNYLGAPAPTAGGDKYPAGVNPQSCPNYPFCDNSAPAGHQHVAPLPGFTERQYPAGVNPHSCPNFPYCS